MSYDKKKIRIDADTVVECKKQFNTGLYDVFNGDVLLYKDAPRNLIDFLVAQEEAFSMSVLSVAHFERLHDAAITLGLPYMMATGGGTYEDFIRDTPTLCGWVNVEEFGFDNMYNWFLEQGFELEGDEPWIKSVLRISECGTRDRYWQPWLRFQFIPGKSYPFPVYDSATVGQGKKFDTPVFLRDAYGWITCTYQEFLAGLLSAGWEFVKWEGRNEKRYASTLAAYGSPTPLLDLIGEKQP